MELEAIVVLGCVLVPPGRPGGAALRRLERAYRAYRDGIAKRIVVSGGRRWFGVSEAEAYREDLCARGVCPKDVLMELCSLSTAENAAFSADLLRRQGLGPTGLVTCDWHMRRALSCFERAGLICEPLSVPSPPATPLGRYRRALGERVSGFVDRALSFGV